MPVYPQYELRFPRWKIRSSRPTNDTAGDATIHKTMLSATPKPPTAVNNPPHQTTSQQPPQQVQDQNMQIAKCRSLIPRGKIHVLAAYVRSAVGTYIQKSRFPLRKTKILTPRSPQKRKKGNTAAGKDDAQCKICHMRTTYTIFCHALPQKQTYNIPNKGQQQGERRP